MTTEAQRAANQRNAAKSTGRRASSARRKKVAKNALLRYGLRARKVGLVRRAKRRISSPSMPSSAKRLQPADAVEEHLVERIAMCAWRLRRMYRIEAELIDGWRNAEPRRLQDLEIGAVFECSPDEMTRLSRYEVAIDRALHRAYVMLERRQARRRGEHVEPPLTVEITGDIEGLGAVEELERRRAEPENFQTKPIFRGKSEPAAVPPTSPTLTTG